MQLSSEMIPGAMVNVLYGPDSELSKACAKAKEYAQSLGVENACCAISNYLFPHGKIVAGNEEVSELYWYDIIVIKIWSFENDITYYLYLCQNLLFVEIPVKVQILLRQPIELMHLMLM